MQYLGIEYSMNHPPRLDPTFIPFGVWREAYLKDAKMPLAIAVERDKGRVSVHRTCIHGTPEMAEADYRYVERYVKFLLWSIGGFRVSICRWARGEQPQMDTRKPPMDHSRNLT